MGRSENFSAKLLVKSFALCILLAVLEFVGTYGLVSAKDTASGAGLYERGGLEIIGGVVTVAGVKSGQDTALGVETGPLLPTPLKDTETFGFDNLRICSKYSTSPGLNPPPFCATILVSSDTSTTGGVLGLYCTATKFSGSQIFFRTDKR